MQQSVASRGFHVRGPAQARYLSHNGEALKSSCRSGNAGLLEKLLNSTHGAVPEILTIIFQSFLVLDHKIRPRAMVLILQAGMPVDNQVAATLDRLVLERRPHMQPIKVLLAFHASVHFEGHRPLLYATKSSNTIPLQLLLERSKDPSVLSKLFAALMADQSFWKKQEALRMMTLFLENGGEGISVHDDLIKAVTDEQPSARRSEITVLQQVNIEHKDEEAL
ncbi:hypothetical protein ONS95_013958 [Cadophora gregata]|uniref:uncharacterized protein n=1 Tax=Cadophora gregata TaxID=51156 RepID=UPI0026DBEB6A|nr:uncharacterized protein ONS95_013958 [Cadophora gregata]KAK0113710.1 hypothetical protein ONS96_014565 [Cadophora gregata f. sp. sojae]KAK0114467.1 hypothetical protein ONS95_013958 [Cadophora gregata]